jgi:hypothetical protein
VRPAVSKRLLGGAAGLEQVRLPGHRGAQAGPGWRAGNPVLGRGRPRREGPPWGAGLPGAPDASGAPRLRAAKMGAGRRRNAGRGPPAVARRVPGGPAIGIVADARHPGALHSDGR